MRILVVDDDLVLVDVLKQSLSSQRHVVDVAEDGLLGWEYIQSGEYELILLDVDLPELDGVSLCEKIRSEHYATPILLMTAKDASQDRIRGLDAGADDYLIKPLDLGELNARIRALSRRGEVIPSTILDVNGLRLNPTSCEVSYQQQSIALTAKEYSLLELFLRNPSRVFSRSQILDRIWTFDDPPLEESVKAHIKGLRKKLKKAGIVDWIENVYGIGYRLNPLAVSTAKTTDSQDNATNSIEREFEEKMEQMWLQYQDKMAERLNVLQNAVKELQNSQLSADLHHQAERAAHKLAGVLGMFGRDRGTAIARELETILRKNPVLDATQQEQFISLTADLDSLLALDETVTANDTPEAKLLLISQDPQLYREFPSGRSPELNWHLIDNLNAARVWLKDRSPYLVAINAENLNKTEYLALIAELNARTPAIPTVVIAASDNLRDRLTVVRAGASSFLVKPIAPTVIRQTIEGLSVKKAAIASVLVVDDDVVFLATLRSILEPWGIRVTTSDDPVDLWQILPVIQPDLLILDVEMPEINGIELCQTLRSDPTWQELPILFLTAKRDAATIKKIFEVGGDDYIAKPVVGAELIARINNRLDRSRLLQDLATKDALTGLTNRPQSTRKLESQLQQAKDDQQPYSLAILKMPDLQQINLQYGHPTGDRILQKWGQIIQAACRDREICSYWGNGDFIIGIPSSKTDAREQLTEILTILRTQIFTSFGGDRFQVECNCAIAQFSEDGTTLHALYQAAFA
jgi:diguanylate cyclase (GGDEF)-like protein